MGTDIAIVVDAVFPDDDALAAWLAPPLGGAYLLRELERQPRHRVECDGRRVLAAALVPGDALWWSTERDAIAQILGRVRGAGATAFALPLDGDRARVLDPEAGGLTEARDAARISARLPRRAAAARAGDGRRA